MKNWIWILLVAGIFPMMAQPDLDPVLKKKYPFIKVDSAHLQNDSALAVFFRKLDSLNSSNQGRVNVVHIGDSHIQADFLSGEVRTGLQQQFGNAGRGFIFPYRLAKSNEPPDYKTSGSGTWEYGRNVFPDTNKPTGIGGYIIQTFDTTAMITITLKATDTMDYSVQRLTLFHAKAGDQFDFAVYDSNMTEIGYISTTAQSAFPYASAFRFPVPVTKFIIKPCPRSSSKSCARIFGMLLENERHGLLYNTIGVNGAEFRHYNTSVHFYEQMEYLAPDLVIVSLGTNEAFNWKGYKSDNLYAEIDTMVNRLRRIHPEVQFIFTTPADSYRRSGRKRVKNPVVKEVRATIIRYARDNGHAYWDLYETAGGYGSMAKWYAAGMADRYRVHFSRKGYQMQGELLVEAILESYARYLKMK
ncbi:MAG: hypothetical protein IT242_07750 [Bacteroidia bacterium]|nr:hypothetical protein [Bacteroidia bacterium]